MSRKLIAATLALTVAGGVYLCAGEARASNMGFKLERSFAVVRENPNDRNTSFLNLYYLSYPLFNGLGDIANDNPGAGINNRCVETGGAAAGDGIVNSTDGLCDAFTSRAMNGASMAFNRFNRDICAFESQTCSRGFAGISFGGTPFTLERDAGVQVTVGFTGAAAPLPDNRAVIVGSHDPSYTGRTIRQPTPDCTPRNDLINLPYHSMYTMAQEILCGMETIDWVDANGDGNPDTCPRGIFDGSKAISVLTFDNVNDDSTITPDNAFTFRSVRLGLGGALLFAGTNFPLTPGDAYVVSISSGHTATTFLSPHF